MTDSHLDGSPQHEETMDKNSGRSLLTRPGFLIRRLHQIHTALFMEATEAYNITPVQYSLLSTLDDCGELDQNSLAHYIGLERTSVAEVLPRLEQRELLSRRPADHDRRVRLVKLSRKGRNLVNKMKPLVLEAHDRTVEDLPEADRALLISLMTRLVDAENNERVPLLVRR